MGFSSERSILMVVIGEVNLGVLVKGSLEGIIFFYFSSTGIDNERVVLGVPLGIK